MKGLVLEQTRTHVSHAVVEWIFERGHQCSQVCLAITWIKVWGPAFFLHEGHYGLKCVLMVYLSELECLESLWCSLLPVHSKIEYHFRIDRSKFWWPFAHEGISCMRLLHCRRSRAVNRLTSVEKYHEWSCALMKVYFCYVVVVVWYRAKCHNVQNNSWTFPCPKEDQTKWYRGARRVKSIERQAA